MRRLVILVAGLLVFASLAATPAAASAGQSGQNCSFPVTLTDATGTEVTIEERPDRVVTTNPSAAQTMWEIGGRDQVVGLTQYASYLEGSASRTNVSAGFGVSREKVAGTNPDLVIAPNSSAGDVQGLRDAGLTVYHLPSPTDIEDIREATTRIGRLTGNCQGAADTNAWMTANVDAVGNLTEDVEDRPDVLYPLGSGYVAASDTFIDAVLSTAGADNAASEYTQYPQLNDEVLLQLDPDNLVLHEQTGYLVDEEPYASTTAGQENAVVTVRERDMSQPAPRSVVNGVHNVTRQLYPDRYDESVYVQRSAVEGATPATVDGDTSGGSGPGFTAVGGVVAVLATALLARRR
ncbi:PGF-CTERM-anchored ABC transporter substrate-binding protein [Haloarcula salinisoli]|uniref:Helical backbone metal receptor n=1 Tax=Haloarcula salinisoli TaxID=2487746 RepID=A0A8J7YNQ7_9EURY|nr:PGF-CTERM-anchored ABC transporter substrate-binding protein [Halomicroarcula salinisoli]MBX0305136.1 helical backbone metal receptor [Halomicroarcula salinisoli]